MKKLLTSLLLLLSLQSFAQNELSKRISIFLDCNTFCDRQFLRTELDQFDFLRDRILADIHLLITSQRTGSGGREYQLLFLGNNNFSDIKDTIQFSNSNIATDFEIREKLVKHLKIGLIPFLIRNGQTDIIELNLAEVEESDSSSVETVTKDPWNYWVINVGGNGRLESDQNYFSRRLGGRLNVNRVTEDRKVIFWMNFNENRQEFTIEDDEEGTITEIVTNNSFNFEHTNIWSLGEKWAYGFEAGMSSSTFSNFKSRMYFSPTIEYNIFPYSEVNNKLLTLRYGLGIQNNIYNDTSIFNQREELLFSQYLSLGLDLNQKWGNLSTDIRYRNYFHSYDNGESSDSNFFYNIGIETDMDIRITGGLSFYIFMFGGIVQDQFFLPKGEASEQDVLIRRRQLQSNFRVFTSFGFNYRFGSQLNNFVNPRFGSDGF